MSAASSPFSSLVHFPFHPNRGPKIRPKLGYRSTSNTEIMYQATNVAAAACVIIVVVISFEHEAFDGFAYKFALQHVCHCGYE